MTLVHEIALLVILFTALAFFFDIHGKNTLYSSIMVHVIAFLIALLLSKGIYTFLHSC